jgi:1,4-alpha-glucan branching enzyme
MYEAMHKGSQNLLVDRGLALHKMARLATLGCCCAYLNFMGNEFGHPEWIDFPREGNNNSYHYARRQWSLRDSDELRFKGLGDFDEAMMKLVVNGRKALEGTYPRRIYGNDEDKVLAFMRGELLFIFNFHSEQSLVDYPLIVPPGVYQHALDTDAEAFGGFNRVIPGQEFPLTTIERENERCFAIRLYLPARTALVIERIPPKVARAGRKKKATTP